MKYEHTTVLKRQLVDALGLKEGNIAIDCTAGGGGHTQELLSIVGATGKVFAIDQDEIAIEHLNSNFQREIKEGTLTVIHERFSSVKKIAIRYDIDGRIHGICADVGVSGEHLNNPARGFSFMKDGPLSMSMSQIYSTVSAAEIINSYPLEELVRIFKTYGEERHSYKIAQAIVKNRVHTPFERTSQLAELIEKITPFKQKTKKHPATKVFQALRIEVNGELAELKTLLEDGFAVLSPAGRFGIISFHSLEDRLVKHYFKELSGLDKEYIPRDIPLLAADQDKKKRGTIIKPFPIIPEDIEIENNVRARSAKLRVIEKIQ